MLVLNIPVHREGTVPLTGLGALAFCEWDDGNLARSNVETLKAILREPQQDILAPVGNVSMWGSLSHCLIFL